MSRYTARSHSHSPTQHRQIAQPFAHPTPPGRTAIRPPNTARSHSHPPTQHRQVAQPFAHPTPRAHPTPPAGTSRRRSQPRSRRALLPGRAATRTPNRTPLNNQLTASRNESPSVAIS
eukprot:366193-Chlamydomonas_euryale.AAC.5